MRRREFIGFVGGVLASPIAARAQQPAKVARVGYLGFGTPAASATRIEALRAGLNSLGYIEGKNIAIEFRWAKNADELDRLRSLRAETLADALSHAGIEVELVQDIHVTIWNKFVFLTGMSAMTALTRQPVGRVRADPETRALLTQIMTETLRVGQASGIPIHDRVVDDRLAFIDALPGQIRASMAGDLAAGRQLELTWLSGEKVRKGAELGVATPANRFVCQALKLDTNGAQH